MLKMKHLGALVGAVTAVISSAFSFPGDHVCTCCQLTKLENQEAIISPDAKGATSKSLAEEIFAPRFDGLRFIETLITAHR